MMTFYKFHQIGDLMLMCQSRIILNRDSFDLLPFLNDLKKRHLFQS